ncbi:lysosomal beta glucosidase-like [Dorcoceras hygrometricum]|uniref:beta-glucosidase n=1 Tax=Dorcoceras hygrometricum TaxID=472368 RepID=A0A2Z7CIV8_9LAMI|nr:lysosomal beta glucosidase-like [Dorcoceras hygrometricum]
MACLPMKMAVVLLLCCCVEAEYLKYKDPKQPLSARIEDLLKRMTLEEKIGQMTMIDRKVASYDVVKSYFIDGITQVYKSKEVINYSYNLDIDLTIKNISSEDYYKILNCAGSLLSGGGSVPAPKASAETWINMVNEFQRGALSTRLGIPMIYGIDAIHGHNTVYNSTIFPHNIGLGVTRQVIFHRSCRFFLDPELIKKIGAATALEVRATGIPYAFSPCIAVCRDPRWGRCFESFSEDHNIVQAMTEIIPGLQGDLPAGYARNFPYVNGIGSKKVAACAKHFVADGGTIDGINENNTILDMNGLFDIHMPAYLDSIRKGVATIMISYSSLNGKKMHSNKELITGYLKKKLKFKGFVISDSEGIDKLTSPPHANYTFSVEASINAGIDMIMVPERYVEFISDLTSLVKRNVIPVSRIDDAVERILRVKFVMGLFDNPMADFTLVKHLGSPQHRELAREAVRRSLVLLKNGKSGDSPFLPLPKKASKILVAGSHANDIGNQCGGWTIEWHGLSGNITIGTTILTAVKNTVAPDTEVIYNENPDTEYVQSNNFSYAIVAVGELPYSETAGDSKNLTLAGAGYDTIANVCKSVKCVVVLITGRPVVIEPYLDLMDSLVAAWLPGTEGQGITDALFGDYGFTGKLARTWFRTVDQLPMNVGDPHYDPLFPFGFGLTTTADRDLKASQ